MTPTTKTGTAPAAAADLRTRRAAYDAPARAREEAEAREREAEQRTRQDAALAYARGIGPWLERAVAALAAWEAAPVDMAVFRQMIGADTPLWRASDAVNTGSWPITDAARVAGEVARLVTELEQPGLLPASRLTAIMTALDSAAGRAEGLLGSYAAWVRVREEAVAQLAPLLKLHYALRRRWMPTQAERALLAQEQQRLADAAAAMPPIPPPAPRRGIPGAQLDAESPVTSRARRPLLETLED